MQLRRSIPTRTGPRALGPAVALALAIGVLAPLSIGEPAAAATPATGTAAAGHSTDRMPGDVPSKKTPWILDGQVYKIVQVDDTMIAGGLFTTVADPMNGPQHTRQNLVAFDAETGSVSPTFNPIVEGGAVQQLLPGPIPGTVYVAGDFTKINGRGPNHLQLLDVSTGEAVRSFRAPSTGGSIQVIELLPNNRLFIGGFFKRIAGNAHGQFATLDATTGALDPFMNLVAAGNHNTGTGAKAPIGPREAGLTPTGDRLVVVGNFRTVDGIARDQIVMIDLTGPTAAVRPDWYTTGYTPICSPRAFDSYMRDVEMSPDGSFFVVATTGGPHAGTLCDSASRFETYDVGTNLTPTWTDHSGGDTLWGVEVTDSAVYVGGHQRWMNNPNGSDRAAQGAVPRPGLVALDPASGVPLRWNPGRNPRGEAAYEIYETGSGVWVVSDTPWIGDRRYQRQRVAFFPYDEGYDTASTDTGALPGNVYIGGPRQASDVLYRVNAGGSALAAIDAGPDWTADTAAAPSPHHNTGSSTQSRSALTAASLVGVPATTPSGIWTSERFDPSGGTDLQWSFPVASGTSVRVRLYFASRSTTTRRFNVLLDGATVLSSYDPNSDPGVNRGTMKSFDTVSDGSVDIDFARVAGDPMVNAVEIIDLDAGSNATTASVVAFDGTGITSQSDVSTGTFDWTDVRGAVMIGRTLFYGRSDGMLYRRSFDGERFGEPVAVNPYLDPQWSTVLTGSGPVGQTYAGMLPAWYGQLGTVTGMFFAEGRIYYTRSGQNTLYWRWFSPDSGIVGGVEGSVAGGDVAWGATQGMFLDGDTLYLVDAATGDLRRIPFVDGAPSGASSVADATRDWRGRALFLASVLPNVAPTASIDYECSGLSCAFDAGGSTDSDGVIESYEWWFGDGEEGGGPSPQKDFPDTGTYEVTLTVTDDGGLTSTTTVQVAVVKPNEPPAAAFEMACDYTVCTYDATGSADSDGTIEDYAWDFGDGETGSGSSTEHSYETPGTYTVTLTVTDDDGATAEHAFTSAIRGAPSASTVAYVGGAVGQGNAVNPNVTTPTVVSTGDRLLLALTVNASSRDLGEPTGITDWTVLGTTTSGSMQTRLYTKIADTADAGARVSIPLSATAKYTLSVAAYSGVRPGQLVTADIAETVTRTSHASPVVTAPAGSWVLSYWADKSSSGTGFALPDSVVPRQEACNTGSGRICSALADSDGAVPTGQYGGLLATSTVASGTATSWSVVLRTIEENQAPTAAFGFDCDGTLCDFDAGESSDPDGSIADFTWDFGDGGSASGRSPSHDFATSGTRDVTLTVTDDEGAADALVLPVSVIRHNTAPSAAYTVSCTFLSCSFDAGDSSDVDGDIVAYAWDFGDGHEQDGADATTTHTYDASGTYTVTLTVTDNDGGTATLDRPLSPAAARPIGHVGSTSKQGNVSTPNTTVPEGVAAGDRLVMVLSLNEPNRVVGTTIGVTGWDLVETVTSGTMRTNLYTKVAQASDAGRTTRFALDAPAKYTLTIAAYSGDMLAPVIAAAPESTFRSAHPTPLVEAAAGDWAVSYWADKSSSTTAITPPEGVTPREATCSANAGRICSLLGDSGAGVPAGPYGDLAGTADASSSSATMWTILLRQAG